MRSGRVVLVHGTDTGVGKTAVTAALAVLAKRSGTVLVVKVAQAGLEDGRGDVDTIAALAEVPTAELARLDLPMAPHVAARLAGATLPSSHEVVEAIGQAAREFDTVLVEGSGGVMVTLTGDGATLPDIGRRLGNAGLAVGNVVVARPSLGTLNHTGLTIEHLRQRGLRITALLLGSWPASPGVVEQENRSELPELYSVPLLAALPEGLPSWGASRLGAWVSETLMGTDLLG